MSKKVTELTTDDQITLFKEHMAGKPLSFKGEVVDKFISEIEKDKKMAEKNGWTLEIPAEIEVA